MILWSIQTSGAVQELKTKGVLRQNANHVDRSLRKPYKWMAHKMEELLDIPKRGCEFPLWCWFHWEGEEKKRPDLRCKAHLPKGEQGARLTIEVDDKYVLFSDFDLWHFVLNYWYLPFSSQEGDHFEKKLESKNLDFYTMKPLPNPLFDRLIVKSWDRIFDLEWEAEEVALPFNKKSIQGTIWEISIEHVRKMDWFYAR